MKYFTRNEAEKAIPKLEKILEAADAIRIKAQSKAELIRSGERAGSLDAPAMAIEQAQVAFLAQCFQETLQAIDKMGAVLKSLGPGLVDFPCRWEGQEIYLCWHQGEKRIENYHRLDEGFAGRKTLPRGLV